MVTYYILFYLDISYCFYILLFFNLSLDFYITEGFFTKFYFNNNIYKISLIFDFWENIILIFYLLIQYKIQKNFKNFSYTGNFI